MTWSSTYMLHALHQFPQHGKTAIKNNNIITWPGITVDLVNKHLLLSIATIRGHIHCKQQEIQSTKAPPVKKDKNIQEGKEM